MVHLGTYRKRNANAQFYCDSSDHSYEAQQPLSQRVAILLNYFQSILSTHCKEHMIRAEVIKLKTSPATKKTYWTDHQPSKFHNCPLKNTSWYYSSCISLVIVIKNKEKKRKNSNQFRALSWIWPPSLINEADRTNLQDFTLYFLISWTLPIPCYCVRNLGRQQAKLSEQQLQETRKLIR